MPAPGSVQLHRRRSAEGGGGGPGKPPPSHPAAARSSPELSVPCSRFVLRLSPGSGRSYRRSALLPPIQAAPLHRRIHAGGLPSAHVAAGGHPWPSIRMHPLRSWGGPGERPQPPAARGSRAGIGAGNAEPQQGATCGAELDPRLREAAVELEPDLQERCGPEGGTAEQDLQERCVTELEPDLQERGTAELDLRERGTAELDLQERCVTELEPDLQERGTAELDLQERGTAELDLQERCVTELEPDLQERGTAEPDLQERCVTELEPDLQERGTAELDLRERCVTELEPDLQERGTAELDLRERCVTELELDLRERCVTELEPDLQERGAAEPAYYSRRRIAEWVLQVNAVLFSPSRPQDPASPHLREQGTSIKIVYQGD
ncbi:uncharacterized protein LOC115076980 [Rhinatrema bivittatum]|uniref:uncharacterized protein LOC115076980 n=1 Tax=Rhinatrema bivittatum TaxID=194408 RepID=UPI00112AF43E|nr:uncharacterized protein LOC115076980 [Rhinatrema bivittatum]XP_029434921.1 uncharacterized protein LOC115076980 [Rhinatrema bivittatum]XP_029434922.1 uncharacterized protein LOC115076980 [Rhinatrema bivittatum]